jgi:hypothetical protein
MNCASWSITTTLSSVRAGSSFCLVYYDRRSTPGRCRNLNRRCGSWP